MRSQVCMYFKSQNPKPGFGVTWNQGLYVLERIGLLVKD